MNEKNVPRERRRPRSRPRRGANGNAVRATDPRLRAAAARRPHRGERRPSGARGGGAGVERAGAARCLSEARRHCWEAAATTTAVTTTAAAVTGAAPGVKHHIPSASRKPKIEDKRSETLTNLETGTSLELYLQ